MNLQKTIFPSPFGEMVLVTRGDSVCCLEFSDEWSRAERRFRGRFGDVHLEDGDSFGIADKIKAYFDGDLV